jgi:hypothetical protein
VDWLPSEHRAAREALVAGYAGDDDGMELLAYRATAHHLKGRAVNLRSGFGVLLGLRPARTAAGDGPERGWAENSHGDSSL